MATAFHGPTDSALSHLLAATISSPMSVGGELHKAGVFIDKVVDIRHKKALREFLSRIKASTANKPEVGRIRVEIEAWIGQNFPTR